MNTMYHYGVFLDSFFPLQLFTHVPLFSVAFFSQEKSHITKNAVTKSSS